MRILFFILFFYFLNLEKVYTQHAVNLEYQRSFENLDVGLKDKMLLSSTSILFDQNFKSLSYAYGFELQESLMGEYGGFYVLGMSADIEYNLFKLPLSLNFNSFLGGGGGSSAPDATGLSYRYAYGLKIERRPFGCFVRKSHYSFPYGDVSGNSYQIGISYLLDSVFNNYQENILLGKQNISFQTSLMKLNPIEAGRLENVYYAKIFGLQFTSLINKDFGVFVRMNAAVSEKIDGYMGYYTGLSFHKNIENSIKIMFNYMLGSSGGGAVKTGGGFSNVIEGGVVFLYKNKSIVFLYVKNNSFNAPFIVYYVLLDLSQSLISRLGFKKYKTKDDLSYKDIDMRFISAYHHHFSPQGFDYNQREYIDMGLFVCGLTFPLIQNFDLSLSSRWAAIGDYGAYAEALFGIKYLIYNSNNFCLKAPINLIISGGGGVDVGSGFGLSYNLDFEYNITDIYSVNVSIGKMKMIGGSYNPVGCNIGFSRKLDFFID